MSAKIMNGYELAYNIRTEMKKEVSALKNKQLVPHLTVILIGDNPASKSYVNGKKRASSEVGISSTIVELPTSITEDKLLDTIESLNQDNTVHGILVQLPIPDHINEQLVIEKIDPKKDVDGFHPLNIGRMMTGKDAFLPCTPFGILTMLHSEKIELEGKHVVIIGRSNIVGKPVGQLLLNENATITYCHSRTKNMKDYTTTADILIVAIGIPQTIDSSYLKQGAVVIDVGINRLGNGSLTGDVDFEDAKEKASYITPVPRGVGPMTIAMLLKNTIKAAKGMDGK